jgi:hypothetical protein
VDVFFLIFALAFVGTAVMVFVVMLRVMIAVFTAVGRALTGSGPRRSIKPPPIRGAVPGPTRAPPMYGYVESGGETKICPELRCRNLNLAAAHYCARCGRRLG